MLAQTIIPDKSISLLVKSIQIFEVDIDEYVSMLKSYQVPGDFISLIQYLFTEVLDGRNQSLTNDIENVLGRKPTTFKEYIDKTIKTGVWNIHQSIVEVNS